MKNKYTPRDIEFYMPYVEDVAREFSTSYTSIGIMDREDLIQAGYEGLVRAWNNENWDAIQDIPEVEQQPYIWARIKTKVKSYIIREIDNCGSFIKVPRRDLEEARAELSGVERVYVDLFPQFFDAEFPEYITEITMWENELLYDFLMRLLEQHVPNTTHRTILCMSYGIDTIDDKPVSFKKIGKFFSKSPDYVRLAKHRTLKYLRENEEVQEKIKIYLEN